MRIYWYAPFNNAYELDVARHMCRPADQLTVQSLRSRFRKPLPTDSTSFRLVRDLPEPAGETQDNATRLDRGKVAVERAWRRGKCLANGDWDLIHLHTFNMFTDWGAVPALKAFRVPLVLSVHNVLPHVRRGPSNLERLLHVPGYRAADRIIVAHERLKEQLVNHLGVPAARVSVIPLVVPSVAEPAPEPSGEVKEFLMFGTIRGNKGIPELLRAIDKVPRELPVRFRFAGRGEVELEALIQAASETDPRIIAEIGWVPKERQEELYRQAWVLLLPYTEFSAQSGVLSESYGFGIPVIAGDVGALGAEVREEQAGWLVAPGDVEELVRAIVEAAENSSSRGEMAIRARRLAMARTPQQTAVKIRALYDQLT